jgi:hypothetical protein
LGLLALGTVIGLYFWLSNPQAFFWGGGDGDGNSGNQNSGGFGQASRFEKLVRAASLLENVQYEQALAVYDELGEKDRSVSVLRNRAIASLANVKYNIDLAQDPTNDVEGIRSRLPSLF